MIYAIYDRNGKEECQGESNYKAWAEFYAQRNTFADNINEFKSHCIRRGYYCRKIKEN